MGNSEAAARDRRVVRASSRRAMPRPWAHRGAASPGGAVPPMARDAAPGIAAGARRRAGFGLPSPGIPIAACLVPVRCLGCGTGDTCGGGQAGAVSVSASVAVIDNVALTQDEGGFAGGPPDSPEGRTCTGPEAFPGLPIVVK